jgi:CRP/FNR family transcriptional regulator
MKKYCLNCIYETLPHTLVEKDEQSVLFLEGDPLTYVYLIKDGLVKMNRLHPSGDEKVFDILGPGDYIALLAVLQGKKNYIASAETLTKTTLHRLSYVDVKAAYQSNPIFKDTCLQCAVTRSNMFQNQLFQNSNIDIEEKILSIFQLLAHRFGYTKDGYTVLDLPFNKTVLANLIGIRRETLSRKLSKMQKEQIIEVDKNKYTFRRM